MPKSTLTKLPESRRGRAETRRATRDRSPAVERLSRYRAKRNLPASGEPAGATVRVPPGAVRRFVIQKHDATRLHYDFRLEMEGVYRSWAVPKGLPTEPGERSLAVEVEDHPLEYGSFEGIIPKGNYGAGTVMLWDRGHYTVSGPSPEQAYREGKLHLALVGEKSVGEWTLVRMRSRPGERRTNWLLIKNSAPAHRAPMGGKARGLSVLSRRSLEEIARSEARPTTKGAGRLKPPSAHRGRTGAGLTGSTSTRSDKGAVAAPARRTSAPKAPPGGKTTGPRMSPVSPRWRVSRSGAQLAPAKFIPPMKALNVDMVPAGKWRLEVKFDGFRAIAIINHGEIALWSRNRKPLTEDYPEVVAALKSIPCTNATIDGEIVALDQAGHPRFQLLQNRGSGARPPIVYYAFDLLHHDGRSLIGAAIEERQIALEMLLGKRTDAVRFSTVFEIPPDRLLLEIRRQGLEGIIAKTPGSAYEPDRRSGTWLKCKVHGEQEFVIGGFTRPRKTRKHFGAVLVGYYADGELRYAGKVGSGFGRSQLATLHREFIKRRTEQCPFTNLPQRRKPRYGLGMTKSAMKDVTWMRPELVAQVQFTEWTEEGSLRHPVFLGLRDDKPAREVLREDPRSA